MTLPTTRFEPGDLITVPYPHVERPVVVARPALVVSRSALGPSGLLIWTMMITSAEREDWPGDLPIPDAESLGLIIPSKIRTAKIAAVEAAQARTIGRLPPALLDEVQEVLRQTLGL